MESKSESCTIVFVLISVKTEDPTIDPITNPAYTADPNVPNAISSIYNSFLIS
jgi:hypothetical protein